MNAEDRNSAAPLTDSNEITYINDSLPADDCGNGFGDRTFYINSNLFADDCRAEIASELHMQRYEYHMPLQVCARRLGVTPLQIEQLETTYTPQVDFYLAVRMARLFGCKFKIELEIDQDFIDVPADGASFIAGESR